MKEQLRKIVREILREKVISEINEESVNESTGCGCGCGCGDSKIKESVKNTSIKLTQLVNEETFTDRQLKDALRGKPYDIEVLSQFLMDKVKDFDGLGYPGYNTYSLNFTKKIQGLQVTSTGDGKRKQHSIGGKELKKLIPTIQKKSGKVNLVFKITKQSVFKPGMTIGGEGYWIVK